MARGTGVVEGRRLIFLNLLLVHAREIVAEAADGSVELASGAVTAARETAFLHDAELS